jgi:hypothetical protein
MAASLQKSAGAQSCQRRKLDLSLAAGADEDESTFIPGFVIPDSKARNREKLRFSRARLSFRNDGKLNED